MLASTIKESNNQSPTSTPRTITVPSASDASDTQQRIMHYRPQPQLKSHNWRQQSLCSTSEHPIRQQHIRLSISGVLLRKEVIQPHLPVRLPCYDFVPIASPTFDGSPCKQLGHRLRVLPTFVT